MDIHALRARELAREKRELCKQFMREEQVRRLEESRHEHERRKIEDQKIAEVTREKALKDELVKAKKTNDNNARELVQQQVMFDGPYITLSYICHTHISHCRAFCLQCILLPFPDYCAQCRYSRQ